MGTQIDLSQEQAEAFGRLSDDERQACEALIQAAVADFLADKERSSEAGRAERRAAMMAGFGIWKDRGIDGLEYQRRIRSEWDDRLKGWGSFDDAGNQAYRDASDPSG